MKAITAIGDRENFRYRPGSHVFALEEGPGMAVEGALAVAGNSGAGSRRESSGAKEGAGRENEMMIGCLALAELLL